MKDLNEQLRRICENHPNHRLEEVATKIMISLNTRIADKLGIPKEYKWDTWWYTPRLYYANYEIKVVL